MHTSWATSSARTDHRLLATEPPPAVPQDQRVDLDQQPLAGRQVPGDRRRDQPLEQRRLGRRRSGGLLGLLRLGPQPGQGLRGHLDHSVAQRADLGRLLGPGCRQAGSGC
jgi:hypothetical protein